MADNNQPKSKTNPYTGPKKPWEASGAKFSEKNVKTGEEFGLQKPYGSYAVDKYGRPTPTKEEVESAVLKRIKAYEEKRKPLIKRK